MSKGRGGAAALLALALIVTVGALGGWGRRREEVRLWGAGDLIPLGQALEAASPGGVPIVWQGGLGDQRLEGLRKGRCDAVLLGYEPTPDQLLGLNHTPIASDAIVFLIDENSYQGGEIFLGRPVARSEPLQGLRLQDLEGMLSNSIREAGDRWAWGGVYYHWDVFVTDEGKPVRGGLDGGYVRVWQRQTPVVRCRQVFEPGRFDTQTALYRRLGLDEREVTAAWSEFTHAGLTREEEVLATEYMDASLHAAGQADFAFRITYASLRVAQLALRHVPVRVLAIDGVDPVVDPEAIVDGRYPLVRRIHIITRQESCPATDRLVSWLQAPEGQRLLENAGYLPLDLQRHSGAGHDRRREGT